MSVSLERRLKWLTRSRARMILATAIATLILAGTWLGYRWWVTWPTRAVLRGQGDTWPLAFSPDSRIFVSSGTDGITLWDARTGQRRTRWQDLQGQFAAVGAFSPDGRTFAAALSRYPGPVTIALFDVETGRIKASLTTRHPSVYAFQFADDGQTVRAFLGAPFAIKERLTVDAVTGQQVASRPLTCRNAASDVAVSPDGHLLAIVPFGGSVITLWDADTDTQVASLASMTLTRALARGFGFTPDGKTLVTSVRDGSFELWDLETRKVRAAIPGHIGGYVSGGIQFSPDGRTLASRGMFLRPPSLGAGLRYALIRQLHSRSWSPADEVIVIDLATGKCLVKEHGAMHPFYSPDGATIATRQVDFSVRLHPAPAP